MKENEMTLADLGFTIALEVFGAPFHYLPWNEKLACRLIAGYVYCAVVVRTLRNR